MSLPGNYQTVLNQSALVTLKQSVTYVVFVEEV